MHNELPHHFQFRRFIHSRYNDLVIADTLRQIALSMVSIFIPIYLLDIGFSLKEVFLYLLFSYVVQIFAVNLAIKEIERWGVKQILISGYLINIILYLLLSAADPLIAASSGLFFLLVIAVITALQTAFFWTAYHFYFLSTASAKDSGSKLGILAGIPVLFGIIGPLLGGYLITVSGFLLVFMASALLLIMASISLFFSRDIKVKCHPIKPDKIIDSRRPAKNWIYLIQGIKLAAFTASWPLIMYYLDISLIGIGSVYLLANVANSVFCYEAGRWSDQRGTRPIIQVGLIGHSVSLGARGLISTIAGAGLWTIFGGIFGALNAIPLETNFYRYAKRSKDYANTILNREFYIITGKIIMVAVFFITYAFFSDLASLRITMIFAALGALAMVLFVAFDRDLVK